MKYANISSTYNFTQQTKIMKLYPGVTRVKFQKGLYVFYFLLI